jgi:hypothetical protein
VGRSRPEAGPGQLPRVLRPARQRRRTPPGHGHGDRVPRQLKGHLMVQLAALLLGFPAGYLIRNQRLALVAMGVRLDGVARRPDDRRRTRRPHRRHLLGDPGGHLCGGGGPGRVGTPRLGQPPGGDAATGRHPTVTRRVAQGRIGAGRTAHGERELRTSAPPEAQTRRPSSALATIVAIRRRRVES